MDQDALRCVGSASSYGLQAKLELGKGGVVQPWLAAQRSPIHSFCSKVQDSNIALPRDKKEKGKGMQSGRNPAFSFNHNKLKMSYAFRREEN